MVSLGLWRRPRGNEKLIHESVSVWTVPWGFGKLLAYINEKYMLPNDIPLIVTEQVSGHFLSELSSLSLRV
jgi:hypothetical protein